MAEAGLAAAGEGTRLSLDLDEDDYVSLESIAQLYAERGHPFGAEWFRIDAAAADRMVAAYAHRYDAVWIASPEDAGTLLQRHPTLYPRADPQRGGVAAETHTARRRRNPPFRRHLGLSAQC